MPTTENATEPRLLNTQPVPSASHATVTAVETGVAVPLRPSSDQLGGLVSTAPSADAEQTVSTEHDQTLEVCDMNTDTNLAAPYVRSSLPSLSRTNWHTSAVWFATAGAAGAIWATGDRATGVLPLIIGSLSFAAVFGIALHPGLRIISDAARGRRADRDDVGLVLAALTATLAVAVYSTDWIRAVILLAGVVYAARMLRVLRRAARTQLREVAR